MQLKKEPPDLSSRMRFEIPRGELPIISKQYVTL